MFEIRKLEQKDAALYENFIANVPNSMFTHSWKYKLMLERLLAHTDSRYLGAFESGKLTAVMPTIISGGISGGVSNSLPFFGSHGGTLVEPGKARDYAKLLRQYFNDRAASDRILSSTIIGGPGEQALPIFSSDTVQRDSRIGQITELTENVLSPAEDLMSSFSKNTRTAIRRSWKSGFEFSIEENPTKLEHVFAIHEENMNSIGGKSKPRRLIDAIDSTFDYGSDYVLLTASKKNHIGAGLLVFFFKDYVEYFMPATRDIYRPEQLMSGLVFEAMIFSIQSLGCKKWNWGGTWHSQNGVYRFKKGFGAADKTYHYLSTWHGNSLPAEEQVQRLRSENPYFYVWPEIR